ncbi:MAG TPA: terminase family protein, partial [Verrucomicrobiota bacterium]|nr:terminase family protein [Verrucomicrobiota bacterium]HQL79703.1 terminase family protein [Verrucomicrobiota bacterium]
NPNPFAQVAPSRMSKLQGVDDCQRVPGLKCLLLRKVGKANLEHFEDLRRKLFANLGHEFSAFRGILTFRNGSRIIAGHFQNEKDIDAYLGLEYDVIGIEEATTLTARKYQDITTCCRTSKPNWRPRIYSTTNPGGVGHGWYRKRFIEPWQRRAETETRFIAARVTDNRWNNPEYMRVLEGLTGWQRRAWLDGDWDIAAGQFFTTLRREVHIVSDFDETRAREWFCALDYGFTHYTVVLLGCTDGDGNLFVVDEHAERLWLPQRHAPAIAAMLGRHSISNRRLEIADLKRFVAGADVFSRQSDGSTVASQYGKLGITLRPANMERVSGWAEILHRFGDPANGVRPRLFIHERCARLVECLPALQHDPNRPEDVLKVDCDEDGAGGDDAADCLRYLVATKSRTIAQRKLRGL